MPQTQRAWLLVVPIAALGVLGGHELAYAVTRTPRAELHGYLVHAPQVTLVLTALSVLGAALVRRGGRLALWPFPAVAITGFVAQEHLEQLQHGGSVPLLLNRPVFLVGVLIQSLVALAVWLLARLLLRVLHAQIPRRPLAASLSYVDTIGDCTRVRSRTRLAAQPRAPPAIA